MIRALTKSETELLLEELGSRQNCERNCSCIFCKVFEEGVQAGRRDVWMEVRDTLSKIGQDHV